MTKNLTCPKCNSNKIIDGAKIIDYSHGNIKRNLSLELVIKKRSEGKKKLSSIIVSDICGNCGNVELRAINYERLWNFYSDEKYKGQK